MPVERAFDVFEDGILERVHADFKNTLIDNTAECLGEGNLLRVGKVDLTKRNDTSLFQECPYFLAEGAAQQHINIRLKHRADPRRKVYLYKF